MEVFCLLLRAVPITAAKTGAFSKVNRQDQHSSYSSHHCTESLYKSITELLFLWIHSLCHIWQLTEILHISPNSRTRPPLFILFVYSCLFTKLHRQAETLIKGLKMHFVMEKLPAKAILLHSMHLTPKNCTCNWCHSGPAKKLLTHTIYK